MTDETRDESVATGDADTPILDYAPSQRRPVQELIAKLRGPAFVLSVALLGGAIAWFGQPPQYTATAYVQLVMAWDAGVDPADAKARIEGHVAGMSRPPATDSPAAGRWSPDEYRRRLNIRRTMDGSVIAIAFTDTDPKRAADTVNHLVNRYVGPPTQRNHTDLQVGILANASPDKGVRSWSVAGIGFGVAMGIGIIVLLLASRHRRTQPIPAIPPAR